MRCEHKAAVINSWEVHFHSVFTLKSCMPIECAPTSPLFVKLKETDFTALESEKQANPGFQTKRDREEEMNVFKIALILGWKA